MPVISPNTDIVLCKNVPLDASYDHTITFANAQAQWSYFYSKRYKVLNLNTYQRTMSNRLRIACTIEEAMQCNYLYFNNSNFEQKFFYAFITGWEYVNNVTTEITYQIDVMQTYLFDIDVKQCFIEREHIQNDYVGANTIPEGLEQGEYVVNNTAEILPAINNLTSGCILIYCTFTYDKSTRTFGDFNGGFISNVYTGLNVLMFDNSTDFTHFLEDCESIRQGAKFDGIVAAFMCPGIPNTYDTTMNIQQFNKKQSGYLGTASDPYQPRNNKLYCYPYNILQVATDLDTGEYRYEDFQGQYVQFRSKFTLMPEPVMSAEPYQYKGHSAGLKTERLTLQHFPQCSMDVDVWKVYCAQNTGSLAVGALSAMQTVLAPVIQGAAMTLTGGMSSMPSVAAGGASTFGKGIVSGNIAGLLGNSALSTNVNPTSIKSTIGQTEVHVDIGDGSLLGVAKSLGQLYDIRRKPAQLNGLQSALNDYTFGYKKFNIYYLTIKAEYARIIDQYFTMFGYATHKVKVPNVWGRKYFNYVQTKGCIMEGDMPEVYKQEVINIFNRGTTFWHTEYLSGTETIDDIIGDYTVNNIPIS